MRWALLLLLAGGCASTPRSWCQIERDQCLAKARATIVELGAERDKLQKLVWGLSADLDRCTGDDKIEPGGVRPDPFDFPKER